MQIQANIRTGAVMMLYHGTILKHLDAIKVNGIRPRKRKRGNWQHTVTSNPNAVYLTSAYAWHFAISAAKNRKEKGLILEVDADKLSDILLCPDEDVLEQGTRKQSGPGFAPIGASLKERTLFYRKTAKFNAAIVDMSLDAMGTCAYYDTVPWDDITRYVEIDWEKVPLRLYMQAADSMVSIMNYRFLQDRHKALTRWFFGDPVRAEELFGFGDQSEMFKEQIDQLREDMKNRDGLKVVELHKEMKDA